MVLDEYAGRYHRSTRPTDQRRRGHGDVAVPMSAGAGSVGELWWTGGEDRWVFFDDDRSSETYAEQVEHGPACGRRLEQKVKARASST